MPTISPLSPPISPPETSPPPTDQTGYTQTVTQGGGTGTPDDPAVIIITAKKNVALDSYNSLMAYGGLTGDQYNAAKDLAFAQMSPEERCAALGMDANASIGIDEGCDNGIYQEVGLYPFNNSLLEKLGVKIVDTGAWYSHIVAGHFGAPEPGVSKFYDQFKPYKVFEQMIAGPTLNTATDIKRNFDGTIEVQAYLPYPTGVSDDGSLTNHVTLILAPLGFGPLQMVSGSYFLKTAYPGYPRHN